MQTEKIFKKQSDDISEIKELLELFVGCYLSKNENGIVDEDDIVYYQ